MAKRNPAKRKNEDEILNDIIESSKKNTISNIRVELKHKNETQKKLSSSIKNNYLTICTGPPGCGKTYTTCAQSLLELKNNKEIEKIVLVKSVTTLKNEELGFLRGTLEEKIEPFVYSFFNNFEKIIGRDKTQCLKNDKAIEVLPIAYMRGINIDNAVIIVDETQNITIENIRTIITRLGENSKMVLLGDLKQIDQKNKYDSALMFLTKYFKNLENVGVVEFSLDDVVRHPLIKIIEPIFEEYQNQIKPQKKDNNILLD
jgi:phosphate starvation-inducible PhoH-like protein